jgi:hypothetical protein
MGLKKNAYKNKKAEIYIFTTQKLYDNLFKLNLSEDIFCTEKILGVTFNLNEHIKKLLLYLLLCFENCYYISVYLFIQCVGFIALGHLGTYREEDVTFDCNV